MIRRLSRWFKREGEAGQIIETVHIDIDKNEVLFAQPRWKVEPVLEWRDLWVGVFIDEEKRRIYFLPLPCVGVVVYWG